MTIWRHNYVVDFKATYEIQALIIKGMGRWICIETIDGKQRAWCEHCGYRRQVFGAANIERKRARLLDHNTSNHIGLLSESFLVKKRNRTSFQQ